MQKHTLIQVTGFYASISVAYNAPGFDPDKFNDFLGIMGQSIRRPIFLQPNVGFEGTMCTTYFFINKNVIDAGALLESGYAYSIEKDR
jgi:hypothetical protein